MQFPWCFKIGHWKVDYDLIAAHALLCAIEANPEAQKKAESGVYRRCCQTAMFLSAVPQSLEKLPDKVRLNYGSKDKDIYQGVIMDIMFRNSFSHDQSSLLDHLLWLKTTNQACDTSTHFIAVSSIGSFNMLCTRSSTFLPIENEGFKPAMKNAQDSAKAFASLGEYNFFSFFALLLDKKSQNLFLM